MQPNRPRRPAPTGAPLPSDRPGSSADPVGGSGAGDPPRVVVFGDVLDDIIVVASTPQARGTDTEAVIRHRAGGAAANTAAWLGSLGTAVDFVGRVGVADRHRHAQLLANAGVVPRLGYDAHDPTGTVVITVDGSSPSMFTDRGASAGLDPDDVPDSLLSGAALLHVTGYSVVHARTPVPLRRLLTRARAAGVAVSVDPGSSGFIDRFGPEAFLDAVDGAELFFPSLDEARVLTGLDAGHDESALAQALTDRFRVVCLVRADGGAVVARPGRPVVEVAGVTTRTADPVGVGDAFAAGFIDAWLTSRRAGVAARRGARAAARASAVVGGRPPA